MVIQRFLISRLYIGIETINTLGKLPVRPSFNASVVGLSSMPIIWLLLNMSFLQSSKHLHVLSPNVRNSTDAKQGRQLKQAYSPQSIQLAFRAKVICTRAFAHLLPKGFGDKYLPNPHGFILHPHRPRYIEILHGPVKVVMKLLRCGLRILPQCAKRRAFVVRQSFQVNNLFTHVMHVPQQIGLATSGTSRDDFDVYVLFEKNENVVTEAFVSAL